MRHQSVDRMRLINRPFFGSHRIIGDPRSLSLIIMTLTCSKPRSAFVMQLISAVRKTFDRHRSHSKYLGIYSRLHSSTCCHKLQLGQGVGSFSYTAFKLRPIAFRRMGSTFIQRVRHRNIARGMTRNIVSILPSIIHLLIGRFTTPPCRKSLVRSALRSMTR